MLLNLIYAIMNFCELFAHTIFYIVYILTSARQPIEYKNKFGFFLQGRIINVNYKRNKMLCADTRCKSVKLNCSRPNLSVPLVPSLSSSQSHFLLLSFTVLVSLPGYLTPWQLHYLNNYFMIIILP